VTSGDQPVFDRLVRTLALAGDKYTPHVMIALSDFMIRNRLGKSSATFTSNTLTYSPMKNKRSRVRQARR
jgi:hypothetical protein